MRWGQRGTSDRKEAIPAPCYACAPFNCCRDLPGGMINQPELRVCVMDHDFEAQRRDTLRVWKELFAKQDLPKRAVLDLQFVPCESGADWHAFEHQLTAEGYHIERYDDGGALEASVGPIDLDFNSIWRHELKTTKFALGSGFLPDGWGFFGERDVQEYPQPKYGLRLFFKHPDIHPDIITRALQLEPNYAWKSGSKKATPAKNPRIAKDTYWNYTKIIQGDEGNIYFYLNEIILSLERNKSLIKHISDTLGHIEIDIQLYGGAHIGSVIDWGLLERIAILKINLGVEVFPKWN